MHGMNAGGKAHFLIETAQTAVLLFKANEDAKKIVGGQVRHAYYADLIRQAAESVPCLAPFSSAVHDAQCLIDVRAALAAAKAKPSDWVVWRINGQDPRLDPTVQEWWRTWRRTDLGVSSDAANLELDSGDEASGPNGMVCFLTGATTRPLATQPKITGLSGVGGLAMGDVMVGFDKAAFASFGLDQSANAAMSETAVQQYVDGLNDLIRNHSRKLANALVVHWYKDTLAPEDDPLAFLMGMDSEEMTEAAALLAVRRLLNAIRNGERPDLGDNRYYALTLSGAAGRVMVRDWMEGGFEDLARQVERWFTR
jgi:CRISPR-associated protein Csd1